MARTERHPSGTPWGVAYAAAGFFVGLVLSGIAANAWLAAHPGMEELSLGGQALAQIGLWIGLVGAAVLASRQCGSGRLGPDFGLEPGRPPELVAGAAVGALGQWWLVPAVAFLMRPLLGRPDVTGPVEELIQSARGVSLVVLVLFVAVGAPVVEELFFRGLLLRSIQRRMGTVWAVGLSSVVFGLAHPQDLSPAGQTLVMVTLMVFGAVLGALAVRTGRLGPPIVAHAAFNAWTVAFLLLR